VAKLVELVKKLRRPDVRAHGGRARSDRPLRASEKISSTRPAVATTSANPCAEVARCVWLRLIASTSNIRFATTAPLMHPRICVAT